MSDKNLWAAIEAGSYRQALTKITKELKKNPNNARYLVSPIAMNLFLDLLAN
jgi:hypothetical protein